ncbi:MAG: short-chain dehydrogenase [Acidocella sp. 20-57-95]|nr:MAG: short-chain dehydrogenase [Acidocella sp. 20-57-95]OYV62687.1 MAG: short-chain dehydrogenase [Acidocella sp. 21-58-7]HQT65298.1 glucose 1-dehydrogenase [Acidocella sp.]HQU05109.1 glucose 1-dehydrogenase [Acidocella sp.]
MLTGKITLITGATAGIGMATARLFAERGAKLLLTGRNEAAGNALAAELGADFLAQDIAAPEAASRLVACALGLHGRLDVLVNNAGVLFNGTVATCTDAEWDRIMAVNVTSVFRLCRAVVPVMAAQKSGAIINVASDWGLVAATDALAYGTSKGAIVQLTRSMAADHARQGIRVNAVCPGDTDTAMLRGDSRAADEARFAAMAEAIPLGRIGQPRDVAAAIAFLASDDAAFITGAMLPVDGGNSAV